MKIKRMLILGLALVILGVPPVWADALHLFFPDLVKTAEIIVEGKVVAQAEINQGAKWNAAVCRKVSTFQISRVHKGNVRAGETIRVLSHFDIICDTSRLENGSEYLLMLKHSPDGYVDVSNGQGTYEMIDLGGRRKVVFSGVTQNGEAPLLDKFRADLAWTLDGPVPASTQPVVTEEAARATALRMLRDAGVDVRDYAEAKLDFVNADTEFTGVAHKGDPMWAFRWETPSAKGENPRSADSLAYCYVNAQTGKAFCGPNRSKGGLSLQDRCRVFLATYGPVRKTYQGVISHMEIKLITEEEFTALVPSAESLYLSPAKDYPEGTAFLFAAFHVSAKLQPVLFVLDPERNVDFVGALRHPTK